MAWGKAGSDTLTSAGDNLDITSMTASKTNQFLVNSFYSGNTDGKMTFNDNNNSVYAFRRSLDGAQDTTGINQVSMGWYWGTTIEFWVSYFVSVSGEEKLGISFGNVSGVTSGTAPHRMERVDKFVPSPDADITRIDRYNSDTGSFDTGSNITALGSDLTPAAAIPAIDDVQDNSLFIDKVNARRYWFTPQTVDTEEAFSFTTTDTVNALWGNRIYGMKLLSGHSGLNKYIKKIKTYHPTNPTGSRLTTGTLYHVILDSSGTEIARSAGVSASSVSNNSWAETTLSSPVKLLENYTVGVTISTGSGSSYLGTAVNNNGSSPTNTTRYYKDESGNVGLSTSETMLMIFDSDPTTGISIPATWTMQPTLEDDFSSSVGWTQVTNTASGVSGGELIGLTNSSGTNGAGVWKDYGLVSDTKFVLRCKFQIITQSGGSGNASTLYFGISDTNGATSPQSNRDGFGIAITNYSASGMLWLYPNGTTWDSADTDLSLTPTATTYYLEIARTSATSVTFKLFSDEYSTVVKTHTQTIASTLNGLRYIMFQEWRNSSGNTTKVAVDDLQIFNGVGTVN